ncbi:MAG: hypothetical protein RJA34_206 [Pseudomonadota bacterium]
MYLPPASFPSRLPTGNQSKPRLLLVDDQAINIQLLHREFAGDYEMNMATSGEQALRICKDQVPDLILLDVEMPGLNGFDVCERLKADTATRDIPVIFVTAHNDVSQETRGLEVGAVDFIAKPINPKVVRARVRTHITLKQQSDLLRELAFHDGLTSLFNRRLFDERLSFEWRRAERDGSPLSLIMLDVDFFKLFNDEYGHQAGDDCLRQVAGVLESATSRAGDIAARYGGEEFACILPHTDLAGALRVAGKLEEQVRALAITHHASCAAAVVTISLGVATKPAQVKHRHMDQNSLLALADAQLYAAKEAGRGQACGATLAETK